MQRWTRREFLEALAAGAALPVLGPAMGCDGTSSGSGTPAPTGAVTATPTPATASPAASPDRLPPNVREVLGAACGRLIPTDADPGAIEAGCLDYIEGLLELPQFPKIYRYLVVGAVVLDRLAMLRSTKRFHLLKPGEQDDILMEYQAGVDLKRDFDSTAFFRKLLDLTIQGFLSRPEHGGNRDRVGWTLVGHPHLL